MFDMYDAVVVGLGAMGSAATWQLALRGCTVVGCDRFTPPHVFGSTHGHSRIIREAYFEHPLYVPLVQRAYALWSDLERQSGRTLFHRTGGLTIGRPDGALVRGARDSARTHGLEWEEWDAGRIRGRVPALAPDADMVAIHEPRAGVLLPETALVVMHAEARRHGAEIRVDTAVTAWFGRGDHLEVETTAGTICARRLVVAAGPWLPDLTADLSLPLSLERAVQGWFTPRDAVIGTPGALPIFILEEADGTVAYGLPDVGQGVKIAGHHGGEPTTLPQIRRTIDNADRERLEAIARRRVPGVLPTLHKATTCIYTNTPDQHFIVARHPADARVLIVSACSGHGFKFAPAIGELAAAMTAGASPVFDPAPFGLARFTTPDEGVRPG